VVTCLLLGPRFEGSGLKPAEDDVFLRAIKFRSKASYGGAVKPSVPCRKILRHAKEPYEYKRLRRQNSRAFSSPKFLLLRYCMSLLVIAKQTWCTNQERLENQNGDAQDIRNGRCVRVALCALPTIIKHNGYIYYVKIAMSIVHLNGAFDLRQCRDIRIGSYLRIHLSATETNELKCNV
jgi:hypothetical protein